MSMMSGRCLYTGQVRDGAVVARRPHEPEVASSNLAPASKHHPRHGAPIVNDDAYARVMALLDEAAALLDAAYEDHLAMALSRL